MVKTLVSKVNDYKDFADLYDFDDRDITKDDIPFYIDIAQKVNGDILELACGTGRVLLPLARAGFNIWGVDLTQEMLNHLQSKLSIENNEVQNRVKTYKGDMTSFNLDKLFSMITIPYRTFQLLTEDKDQIDCLKCVHNHLKDDGLFILTVFNPGGLNEDWVKYPEQEDWSRVDKETGMTYRATNAKEGIDVEKQVIYPDLNYYITDSDGNQEKLTQKIALKYYEEEQISSLLENNGFKIEERYGYYDKRAIGTGVEMIFVCSKSKI